MLGVTWNLKPSVIIKPSITSFIQGASLIGHLENIGLLNSADLYMVDTFLIKH